MSTTTTTTTTTEFEFAVFDNLGFNPESVSPTLDMARKFAAAHANGEWAIRTRTVSEWEATDVSI